MSTPGHPHFISQEFLNSLSMDQFVSNHQLMDHYHHQQRPDPENQPLVGYPQTRSKHYTFGGMYIGQANSQANDLLITPDHEFSPPIQAPLYSQYKLKQQTHSHPDDFQVYHNGFEPQEYPLALQVELQEKTKKEYHSPATSTDSYQSVKSKPTHSRTSSSGTFESYPEVVKPKVATTFWDDENTVCYQVRSRGVLVSRREDNDYINGTKLLNVIGMTRGKRDGILKTEKARDVIKVGSMNLKGVWIPFSRAYEIARNEGIDAALYPLFVEDIRSYYRKEGFRFKDSNPGTVKNTPRTKESMAIASRAPEPPFKLEDEHYPNMFR